MLRIAICDDQPLHGEAASKAVADCLSRTEAEIRVFDSPERLLDDIGQGGYCPQIAILDIRMDGLDGIELARRLNALSPACAIIFLTSFLEYATEVYDTEHVYFIVKSELKDRIGAAIEKALHTEPVKPLLLYFLVNSSVQAVPAADVLYVERCLRKTKLQMADDTLWTGSTPGSMLKGDAALCFIRCHQSYWVNFRHIRSMHTDSFVLYDGSRIPITRTYRAAAKERFFDCIRRNTGSHV